MDTQCDFDLHTHSTCSDGELTPQQLINLAGQRQIRLFSITDHDNIESYFKVKEMKEHNQFPNNLIYIPGVELNTLSKVDNSVQHFLVYFPFLAISNRWPVKLQINQQVYTIQEPVCSEQQYKAFLQFNQQLINLQISRTKRIVKYFNCLNEFYGWNLDQQEFFRFAHIDVQKMSSNQSLGRPHIAKFLLKHNIVSSVKEAFNTYLSEKSDCFVQQPLPEYLETVCEKLTPVGAKCFIAHPNLTTNDAARLNDIIFSAMYHGASGIEKYHSATDHTLFQDFEGIVSIGSDYHNEQRGYAFGIKHKNLIMKEQEKRDLLKNLFDFSAPRNSHFIGYTFNQQEVFNTERSAQKSADLPQVLLQ